MQYYQKTPDPCLNQKISPDNLTTYFLGIRVIEGLQGLGSVACNGTGYSLEAINNCQTFALTGVKDRIRVNHTCINTHVIFCRVEDENLTIVNCFYGKPVPELRSDYEPLHEECWVLRLTHTIFKMR